MKVYNKNDLLGAIFKWTKEYEVIENGDDVALKGTESKNIYSSYNIERLNDVINTDYSCIITFKKQITSEPQYEIC